MWFEICSFFFIFYLSVLKNQINEISKVLKEPNISPEDIRLKFLDDKSLVLVSRVIGLNKKYCLLVY